MKIEFQPQGVCARQIIIDIENDIVNDVKFIGGCSGNTQGVGALAKGMKVSEVIERLKEYAVELNLQVVLINLLKR